MKGEGPIFEFESNENIETKFFSFSATTLELDDGDVYLLDGLYINNNKIEISDYGNSLGGNRVVKIWKQNGEVYKFEG